MDRILAELRSATAALQDATSRLSRERRARRLWVAVTAAAIVVMSVLIYATWVNSQEISDQAKQQEVAECELRNDTRSAIRGVLEFLIEQGEDRTAERRAGIDRLLGELDVGVLEIRPCQA